MSAHHARPARRRTLPTALRSQWPAFAMTGGLAVVFFLLLGQPILKSLLVVLFLSALLAYVVSPLVEFLRARVVLGRRRRPLSLGTAIALAFATLGAVLSIGWIVAGESVQRSAIALREAAPEAIATAARRVDAVERVLGALPTSSRVDVRVSEAATAFAASAERHALEVIADADRAVGRLPWLAATPFVAYLLLRHSRLFRRSALRPRPRSHIEWRLVEFLSDVNASTAAFVRASLLAALFIGASCTIGFALLRVPGAALLGLAAGILELLPVLGPITVAIVATNGLSAEHALLVLAFLGALRLVQDYWVYPRLIRRGLRLHVLLVIAAILIGAELGGIAGIVIAVPVLAMLSVSLRHWREHREIEEFVRLYARPVEPVPALAVEAATLVASEMPQEVARPSA